MKNAKKAAIENWGQQFQECSRNHSPQLLSNPMLVMLEIRNNRRLTAPLRLQAENQAIGEVIVGHN